MEPMQHMQAMPMQSMQAMQPMLSQDDSLRNLIVNYIPNSLTPDAFKNMFSPFGEIESYRLIKDKLTGVSQGFGFVKYLTPEAAAKAIEVMNGQTVENKQLKVSLAKPPTVVKQQANVYVASLPKHFTKADLEQMFIPYGSIVETKILHDTNSGVSRGVGFVRFADRDQAQIAIDSLNNHVPLGAEAPIVVRFSETKEEKTRKGKVPAAAGAGAGWGMFKQMRYNPMGVAPPQVPPQAYATPSFGVYQPQGASESAAQVAMYNAQFNHAVAQAQAQAYSMPSPTPQMQSSVPAMAAQTQAFSMPPAMPQMQSGVPGAMPSVQGTPGLAYCLFVYNLPPDSDESLLYRLFGPFGAVSDVKIMKDPEGKCKGFGFVHYLKLEDAQQAIVSLNGYQLNGRHLQVSFKKQK